jgi:hypothetical protein
MEEIIRIDCWECDSYLCKHAGALIRFKSEEKKPTTDITDCDGCDTTGCHLCIGFSKYRAKGEENV